MVLAGSSCFTVPGRPHFSGEEPGAGSIVVWLWGEHDLSTDDALGATLARAIALDSAGLVLDLSEVEFMAVSTFGVIVRARELLRQRSRSLTVRCPSAFVRRVIDACGLNDLFGPDPEIAVEKGKALGSWVAVPGTERSGGQPGSWVAVPATERSGGQPGPWAPVPGRTPACVGRTSVIGTPGLGADRLAETA
jgi:anti-anti-sigma factor